MIKNYFKIASRILLKNKVYSMVNIFGLAIGMTACFLIFQYVYFELGYDRFNKNAESIYRIPATYTGSLATSNLATVATNQPAVGPAMKADFPEVVDFARIVHSSVLMVPVVTYTDQQGNTQAFNEERIYMADPSFLTMFSFPFVSGDPKKVLAQPNSVVISRTISKKYFGNASPIGKTIYINIPAANGISPLKITGVFKDVPSNSHIKFDILVSFLTMGDKWGYDVWTYPEFYNYVQLAAGVDAKKLEAKLPAFIKKYLGEKMKELNFGCIFQLQPLTDIHLRSNYLKEAEANGSEREIYFLSVIGVFILIIAWINYINLSTAKSIERAKEVGLRKVVGAGRMQLIGQFIFESIIINLLAVIVSVIIVVACIPYFDQFTGKNLSEGFFTSGPGHEPWFWVALFAIFIAGSLLVGAYPSFILSAPKPALAIKGKIFQSNKGISLRKLLVSFQFILSILLISATITVYKQLSFMRSSKLGYNKDQVLVINGPTTFDSTLSNRINSFQTELRRDPSMINVSSSSEIPGRTIGFRNSVRKASDDKTHNFITYLMAIDDNFINTFQIDMAAGRNFRAGETSMLFKDEKTKVIINEEVVHGLGYKNNEEAFHHDIVFKLGDNEVRSEIIGVMKNYHQRSLKEHYDPILYFYPDGNFSRYLSINVHTNNMDQSLAHIKSLYKNTFPGNPFGYFFLDDYFNQQYQSDQKFGDAFSLFTMLAIFVACLGLLGLTSFVLKLRTKEIGIRKVLGASILSLLVLFSKDFVKLVLVASLIAMPIIYFAAHTWLNNYAFHINLGWYIFLLPPLLLLIISLVTIALQSFRAAIANPIKSLRSE